MISILAVAGLVLTLAPKTDAAADFDDVMDGNWTDDATWSPAGFPDGFSDVIVDGFTVTVNTTDATAENLDINTATGKVEITTISGVLTILDTLIVGAGAELDLQSGGTLKAAILNTAGTTTLAAGAVIDSTVPVTVTGGGWLVLADSAGLAAGNSLTLNGGTLKATGDATIARTVTLGAGGGTFDAVGGATMTLPSLTGDSTITKTGDGRLDFTDLATLGPLPNVLIIDGGRAVTGPNQLALSGGDINIADAGTVEVSGMVSRKVVSTGTGIGTLRATGHTSLGNFSDGFQDFAGKLDTQGNTVVLNDLGTAEVTRLVMAGGGVGRDHGSPPGGPVGQAAVPGRGRLHSAR